jgi:hypothetical protein
LLWTCDAHVHVAQGCLIVMFPSVFTRCKAMACLLCR